ncbi:hypothetical protein [Azohydromonas sediminis]|uniref:hypothetical protein n=1 Tax=Azohydromonas sediminis TaxID=2259674 RepID=UPI000E64EE98|nr:hypothetical protein [Azohydromonas sediminis]
MSDAHTLARSTLVLDTPSPADRTAFEIGWDHAHYRLVPPADHLHEGHPMRQGWEAGQAVFGARTLRATPHVRKWLQLRLNAWLRGKAFDTVAVTPHFLKAIDVPVCPITGEALTHGTGLPSDASVDRVNNDAGYAAGNLAVMSVRANRAKSLYDWRDAACFARQIEAGRLGTIDGLSAGQWARLASLMSLCTPLTHAEAASLPLLVLPPPRLRVLNPVQALQVVLTLRFCYPGRLPRVDQVVALFPEGVRLALHNLLTTLLARRIAAGPAADAAALRRAMEAAWAQPLVLRRWQRVALRLTPAQCERIVELAVQRRLAGSELRCLSFEVATDGWALETNGRAAADSPEPMRQQLPAPAAVHEVTALPPTPARTELPRWLAL